MRLLAKFLGAFVVLAALAVGACENIIIRPPGDAAGDYANPGGVGRR